MQSGLVFEIAATKPSFSLDEDITLRLYLFNLGDDDVTVNSRFAVNLKRLPGEVSLDVIGPSGKRVPFLSRVNLGEPTEEDFTLLVPLRGVGRQYALQPSFDIGEPGRYQVSATYRNAWPGERLGIKAWVGSLRSGAISFEVERGEPPKE